MKRIYIDVTQAYAWEGKATGIVRVMDEMSSRFADDTQFDPIYLTWDEVSESFHKIDFIQKLAERERKNAYITDENAGSNQLSPEDRSLARAVKHTLLQLPLATRMYWWIKRLKNRVSKANHVTKFESNSILFMPHGGVWESTLYTAFIQKIQIRDGVRLVPILYDMCPVITPQFCSRGVRLIFNKYMRVVLPLADLVLAISENTKKDAQAWLKGINAPSIPPMQAFRLGDEVGTGEMVRPQGFELESDYILCVGTVEARKNHTALYYAYKLAVQRNIKLPKLVIAGRRGWLSKDIYEMITNDPEVKSSFIFVHDANDNELVWLYENSSFTVYPSFYEGWGLPVAESLLRGKPCIASNTSSIPEIAGDLLEYFSPYSPEELLKKITNYTNNEKALREAQTSVTNKYKATSWEAAYTQITDKLVKL